MLQQQQQLKAACPRLVDYLAIVGQRRRRADAVAPQLLRRYPPGQHADFGLSQDVVYFCQPDGCHWLKPGQSRPDSWTHVFTLTEKDSGRVRYGVCLSFYWARRLTSLCLVSHHAFFNKFAECLRVLHRVAAACHRRRPHGCRESVWSLLTGVHSGTGSQSLLKDVEQIEIWILRLLSAPAPVPGVTKVQVTVLPEAEYPPLLFALPDSSRLSLADFPLHLPLELLGAKLFVRLLAFVMLEHKVVLQSADLSCLTHSVLALVAVLYPLQYMFPVIPLLPACMESAEQLLLAPTPFLIGLPASFLRHKRHFCLPQDVCLVDLDTKQLIACPSEADTLEAMPELERLQLCSELQQCLEALVSMRIAQSQPIKNLDSVAADPEFLARQQPSAKQSAFDPLVFGNDVDSVDVGIRAAMVRFINSDSVLGDLAAHSRTLRLHPRPVVAFQCHSFLQSRRKRSRFVEALAATQAVEYLAEWALCPDNHASERLRAGVCDPALIGDKPKWYSRSLRRCTFDLCRCSAVCSNLPPLASEAELHDDEDSVEVDEAADGDTAGGCVSGSSQSAAEFEPPQPAPAADSRSRAELLEAADLLGSSDDSGSETATDEDDDQRNDEAVGSGADSCRHDCGSCTSARSRESANSTQQKQQQQQQQEQHEQQQRQAAARTHDDSEAAEAAAGDRLGAGSSRRFAAAGARLSATAFSRSGSVRYSSVSDLSGLRSVQQRYSKDDASISDSFGSSLLSVTGAIRQQAGDRIQELLGQPQQHSRQQAAGRQQSLLPRDSPRRVSGTGGDGSLDEDQRLLKEVANSVLDGQGVGMLRSLRLRGLLEREQNRSLLLQRLHRGAGVGWRPEAGGEQRLLPHVLLPAPVFRGYAAVLRILVAGLEFSFFNVAARRSTRGAGGVGSALTLLEIAHTHCCLSPAAQQKAANSSDSDSPGLVNTFIAGSPVLLNGEEYQNIELRDQMREMLTEKIDAAGAAGSRRSDSGVPLSSPTAMSTKSFGSWSLRQTTVSERRPSLFDSAAGDRIYLYEALAAAKDRSRVWDSMQFWEDVFLDTVATERDIVGMDASPEEMLSRYCRQSSAQRKRQELEEDRLLSCVLYNVAACMLMMRVDRQQVQRKVRRLLAKSHVGLHYSREVNELLDSLPRLGGNAAQLKAPPSRFRPPRTFAVGVAGQLKFLEVCADCAVLRSASGDVVDKLWYDGLATVTYSPDSRQLAVWRCGQQEAALLLLSGSRLFRCLRRCLRQARTDAAASAAADGCSENSAVDCASGSGGSVSVRPDGVQRKFGDSQTRVAKEN